MPDLTLDDALTLLAAAVTHARAEGIPIAAAVLDTGGMTIAAHRMDGCFPDGLALADKKAYGALNLRTATATAAEAFPAPVQQALTTAAPRVTFLPGGIPIHRGEALIGALGVTGGTGEQDVACCAAALNALPATTA